MKHHYLLIIIHFLYTTPCNAMETENNLNILMELSQRITGVKEPLYAQFINNEEFIIAGKGCSIINLITKEIRKIHDFYCSNFTVHPNKKKCACTQNHRTLIIYNTETGKEEWRTQEKRGYYAPTFNPFDDTILLSGEKNTSPFSREACQLYIIKHNYITNQRDEIKIDIPIMFPRIIFHPKKPFFHITDDYGNIYAPGNFASLDELNIGSYNIHFLGNPKTTKIPTLKNEYSLRATSFHPNNAILVALYRKPFNRYDPLAFYIYHYWNLKKQKSICNTYIFHANNNNLRNIAVSPDGTRLITLSDDGCIISTIPTKVIYKSKTKEKLPYLIFVLNHIKEQQKLPLDFTHYCKNILLATFKR